MSAKSKLLLAEIRGNACWGRSKADHSIHRSSQLSAKDAVPLFGSPPPPKAQTPLNASNPHDPVIIARRTLANWALTDGVQPFILADSRSTVDLTKSVRADVKMYCDNTSHQCADSTTIDLQFEGFEIHPSYNQPTYRGLFKAALKQYPDAPAVMYSNTDVLYAPSLTDTIRGVQKFVEGDKLRQLDVLKQQGRPASEYKVRGWMIIGQRINFLVPAEWSPLTHSSWPSDVYTQFASEGEMYTSDAEDYFIVSRGLFGWDSIPDFVIGGVAFDNWITSRANMLAEKGEAIVVDGTRTILAVHQNHGRKKASHRHPKSQYNARLATEHGGLNLRRTSDALVASEFNSDGLVSVYHKHKLMNI